MQYILAYLFFLSITGSVFCDTDDDTLLNHERSDEDGDIVGHYTHEWAAEIHGGLDKCHEVASRHGFICVGQVGTLDNIYLMEHTRLRKRSADPHPETHERLSSDSQVHWAEQQRILRRRKRDVDQLYSSAVLISDQVLGSSQPVQFNDPFFSKQWYLRHGAANSYDMNVDAVWRRGYTGKGSVVTILDDGIERTHPDISRNYDPQASTDINDGDDDPTPRYDPTNENRHGTRCAGEVAAEANNNVCSVGIAYGASIGGVRMLDGKITDAVEARSLSHNPQHIHMYSASWGPDDDGRSLDGPGTLAERAIRDGIAKGRGGLGSLFVWASGNGGRDGDSCACDGYTNNIFTLSVSSAAASNSQPWYLEQCASTLATTYSSGSSNDPSIATTDLRGQCTDSHSGTSASAPLAAAILALLLEANPMLTWRDVQYITLLAANDAPLVDGEWNTNAVGRRVSLKYGYGLMDAEAMVRLGELWTSVPPQHICSSVLGGNNAPVSLQNGITRVRIAYDACTRGPGESMVRFAEHVQCVLSISRAQRSDLSVTLVSPGGTRCVMLPFRPKDVEGEFHNWPFMSVHFWGEQPAGEWVVEINNRGSHTVHLMNWQLVVYGTDTPPVRLSESLRFERLANASRPHLATVPGTPKKDDTFLVSERVDRVLQLHMAKIERPTGNASICHSECAGRCSGPTAFDCLRCRNFELVHGKVDECVRECPFGTYALRLSSSMDMRLVCRPCHQACLSCVGPSEYNCTLCITESTSAFATAAAAAVATATAIGVTPPTVGTTRFCEPTKESLNLTEKLERLMKSRVVRIVFIVSATVISIVALICAAWYCTRRSGRSLRYAPLYNEDKERFSKGGDELDDDEEDDDEELSVSETRSSETHVQTNGFGVKAPLGWPLATTYKNYSMNGINGERKLTKSTILDKGTVSYTRAPDGHAVPDILHTHVGNVKNGGPIADSMKRESTKHVSDDAFLHITDV